MPPKKKLSKKELDTINFRDSVTKKLQSLDASDRAKAAAKAAAKESKKKASRRNKIKISLRGLKWFQGFMS